MRTYLHHHLGSHPCLTLASKMVWDYTQMYHQKYCDDYGLRLLRYRIVLVVLRTIEGGEGGSCKTMMMQ